MKVAADLIVLVADLRGEEQMDGLDRAGGDDNLVGFDAVRLARRSADEDSFNAISVRGEKEFGDLRVKDDASFALCAESLAECVRQVAMREGCELRERGVELRELIQQCWCGLMELREEFGGGVRE